MHTAAVAAANGTAISCIDGSNGAMTSLAVQIAGISGDTITFEATVDGSNWVAIQFKNLNSGTEATTATADGIYRATVLGLLQVRARISTYSAGTINVKGIAVA